MELLTGNALQNMLKYAADQAASRLDRKRFLPCECALRKQ